MSSRRPDFAHSMTDLMASVAVTFLLIAAIFIVKAAQAQKKAEEPVDAIKVEQRLSEESLQILLGRLQGAEGIASVAKVERDPRDPFLLTITYRSDKLTFDKDQFELKPAALDIVKLSFPVLVREICKVNDHVESVFLEGHTDGLGFFRKNVELSSRRAHSVFFAGREAVEADPTRPTCQIDSKFTVAGRGPLQPLHPLPNKRGADPSQRQDTSPEDRRVEIKVRFSGGERGLRELKGILPLREAHE